MRRSRSTVTAGGLILALLLVVLVTLGFSPLQAWSNDPVLGSFEIADEQQVEDGEALGDEAVTSEATSEDDAPQGDEVPQDDVSEQGDADEQGTDAAAEEETAADDVATDDTVAGAQSEETEEPSGEDDLASSDDATPSGDAADDASSTDAVADDSSAETATETAATEAATTDETPADETAAQPEQQAESQEAPTLTLEELMERDPNRQAALADEAARAEEEALLARSGAMPAERGVASIHDANEGAYASDGEPAAAGGPLSTSHKYYKAYDPRKVSPSYLTPVKNQDFFSVCWAFAATGIMESNAKKQFGGTPDLSERHLAYFTFHEGTDPLGNLTGDRTYPIGQSYGGLWLEGDSDNKDTYLTSGGNSWLAGYTLASWAGPVKESVAPYSKLLDALHSAWNNGSTAQQFLKNVALSKSLARSKDAYHLSGVRRVSMSDRDDVKNGILQYGACTTQMNTADKYRNNVTNSVYNYETDRITHDVMLVGWDDNYSRKNFLPSPPTYCSYEYPLDAEQVVFSGTTLKKTVSVNSSSSEHFYMFTPPKAGSYTLSITSLSGSYGSVALYMASSDHRGVGYVGGVYGTDSSYTRYLDTGTTYYLRCGGESKLTFKLSYGSNQPQVLPKKNGAWLVKNSYGTERDDKGFFWISYEDKCLTASSTSVNFFIVDKASTYTNNYQYDGSCGSNYNYVNSGGAIANIFTAKANKAGAEQLKAVSFWMMSPNVNYSIQVYKGVTAGKPTSGYKALSKPVTGKTSYEGYYTVKLPTTVKLTEGERYSVVITLTKADKGTIAYLVDSTHEYSWVGFTSKVSKGQSFERDTAKASWDDLATAKADVMSNGSYDESKCCARIKAFTTNIASTSLAKAKVTVASPQYYTGKALKPAPKVVLSGKTLVKGRDYTVSYANNVKIGTATVTIKGAGGYTGTLKATFKIVDRWQRLAGANAVATMQAIVRADGVFTAAKVDTVVVAGRRDFKAALAGTGLAGLYKAPLLITDPNSSTLSGPAKAELQRLRPSRVIVVGDAGVVPASHYTAIQKVVPKAKVSRVAGKTASATAVAIARAGKSAPTKWGKTCVVATQAAFKDALSIAPYAYCKHAPIFFTESTRMNDGRGLSPETLSAIRSGGYAKVLIVGGELAVPKSVESQLSGIACQRLAGANAIETSRLIGQFELKSGMSRRHLAVATTWDFADALAGASLAGAQNSIIVLANQTGGYAAFDALCKSSELQHGHILGGPFALSEASERHFRTR